MGGIEFLEVEIAAESNCCKERGDELVPVGDSDGEGRASGCSLFELGLELPGFEGFSK